MRLKCNKHEGAEKYTSNDERGGGKKKKKRKKIQVTRF